MKEQLVDNLLTPNRNSRQTVKFTLTAKESEVKKQKLEFIKNDNTSTKQS